MAFYDKWANQKKYQLPPPMDSKTMYQRKLRLIQKNPEKFLAAMGNNKTEANRYINYFTIRAAAEANGIDYSMAPGLQALDELIQKRPEYEQKFGKNYNKVYDTYLKQAEPDIGRISKASEWKSGGAFGADLYNSSPFLQEYYSYDSKNPEDAWAQKLNYAPSALNQDEAKKIVAYANSLTGAQGPESEQAAYAAMQGIKTPEEAFGRKRPVTQEELANAVRTINDYWNGGGPVNDTGGIGTSVNLSSGGYGGTVGSGGQPIPREIGENKQIITTLQTAGLIDADIDVESLTPQELQTTASEGLKKYSNALISYQYGHSGASYPGAATEQPMTIEEIDAEIAKSKEELGKMEKGIQLVYNTGSLFPFTWGYDEEGNKLEEHIKGLEEYRTTAVRNEAIKNLPKTVQENTNKLQQYETKKELLKESDPDYEKKKGDLDIQIQELKDNGYYLEKTKDKADIEDEVLGADDLLETTLKSNNVNAGVPEYILVAEHGFLASKPNPDYNSAVAAIDNPAKVGGLAVLFDDSFKYLSLTDDEKKVLRYLAVKGMKDEKYKKTLEKYIEAINRVLDKRRSEWMDKTIRDTAKNLGDFGPYSAAAFSMFTNLGTPLALAESANQSAKNSRGEYEPSNPYALGMLPSQMTETSRDVALEGASPLLKQLGNLGFSIGDMLMALPFGPTGSLIILSSEAAGQASYDITKRGGTPDQAFWGGVAAGAIEAITEKIPLDNLFKIANSGTKFFSKQGLKNMLRQSGVEASEEWISEVFNNFTDYAIMGDRSQMGKRLAELIEDGMSPAEAQKQVFNEFFIIGPLEAAEQGLISGGIFAGGANVVSDVRTNSKTKQTTKGNIQLVSPVVDAQTLEFARQDNTIVGKIKPSVSPPNVRKGAQTVNELNNQAQDNGNVVPAPPTNIDPNAVVEPKVQDSVINAAREMQLRAEETQADIYNDNVKNAFYQFRINPTNANAEAFYNTSIQNIETAITAEQKAGTDISALEELKGKTESAKSEAVRVQPDTRAQAARAAEEKSLTRAVAALSNLPAGIQAQADAYAARQALYDYLNADESGKAAAYNKAMEQLRESISSALEMKGLDEGTRQALEGMLEGIEVDGGNKSGDVVKYNKENAKKLTKEQLEVKPKFSPETNKWFERGGEITIDKEGVWTYHDWEGNSVKYVDGYPDFKSAGLVIQEVPISEFESYPKDFSNADRLAPNGPKADSSTWHHYQDGRTLQEVNTKIHKRFNHQGGMALKRK